MINLKKLKEIRQHKGFTQTDLAKKVGIAPPHYSNIEGGKRGFSAETLQAIVQALEINIDDIWDNDDDTMPPIFPVHEDGIVVERTKFILPKTAETYQLIAEQISGSADVDPELRSLVELWNRADTATRKKAMALLADRRHDEDNEH